MSTISYTLKIKEICDSLGSISVNVDDEEMVQICLDGLAPRFDTMRTAVLARENPPCFFNLQSMLLVEENHVRTRSNASEGHMLYTHSNGGRGSNRARRFTPGRGRRGLTYVNNFHYRLDGVISRGTFKRMESFHAGTSWENNPIKCGYCGKIGHHEEECRKKKSESASTSGPLSNFSTNSKYDDYGGLFVMRHRANSMSVSDLINTSNSEDICFVYSDALNHMISYQEWFWNLWEPDRPDYVKTRDDTTHPILHVGNVPFGKDDEQTCIENILHVPNITKNLVSVGQIV